MPAFFNTLGFAVVDRAELPYKVYKDCQRCPLYPNCDEIAVARWLDAPKTAEGMEVPT